MIRSAASEVRAAWDDAAVTPVSLAGWLGMTIALQWAFGWEQVAASSHLSAPVISQIGAATAGWAVGALVLALSEATVIQRSAPGVALRAAAVATYLLAGWATGMTTALLCRLIGLPAAAPAAVYAIAALIWLSSLAVLIDQHQRYRGAVDDLADQCHDLELTRQEAVAALADTRTQLREVTSQVERAVQSARTRVAGIKDPAEYLEVSGGLLTTVQYLIRPVSHQLAKQEAGGHAASPAARARHLQGHSGASNTRVPTPGPAAPFPSSTGGGSTTATGQRLSLMTDIRETNPFRPFAVGVNLLPLVLAALIGDRDGAEGHAELVAALAAAWLVLALAAVAWDLRPLALGPRRTWVALAIYAALIPAYLLTISALAPETGSRHLLGSLLPAALAFLAGAVQAMHYRRQQTLAQVTAVVDAAHWASASAQQQLWASQRQLGLALHGRVQAGLTATALMLQRWARSGPERESEAVLRERLEAAFADSLDAVHNAASPDVQEVVDDLTDIWAGVLQIEPELQPAALARLAAAPSASTVTCEILRELILNAVRHGGAEVARIRLRLYSPSSPDPENPKGVGYRDAANLAELQVSTRETTPASASARPPQAASPGMGLHLVNSLAYSAQIAYDGNWRTTTVLLVTAT